MSIKRKQCEKCPWKVITDPRDIPDGYDAEKHRALSSTIAEPGCLLNASSRTMRIMACHETGDTPCVGWLVNQLGEGNNIGLRLAAMSGRIDADVETVGDQHATLEDTIPK